MALRILFVALLQALFVASRPAPRDTVMTVSVGDASSGPQCVRFNSPVCNTLGGQGYSYASFPNPLAPAYLPTHNQAELLGNAAISLAVKSKCSPDVAVFLCFAYFPLCAENQPPVLPCKSLCERVRSDCEPYLNSTYNIQWPQWADCDNIDSVVARNGGGCINATSSSSPPPPTTPSSPATTFTPLPTTRTPAPPVCGTCSPIDKVFSTTFRLQYSNLTFGKLSRVHGVYKCGANNHIQINHFMQLLRCPWETKPLLTVLSRTALT